MVKTTGTDRRDNETSRTMPKSKTLPSSQSTEPSNGRSGASFRRRYDELERNRSVLVARLAQLRSRAGAHPACNQALKLLNETYRKSSLAQRIGVLQAASFMLDIIERLTLTL